jgi:protein transport protein SEC24
MTQQFGQMGMGAQPPQPLPPQQQGVQMRLNPLQPVDISAQGAPFHVSDLDQPPPPIILPANASTCRSAHTTECG